MSEATDGTVEGMQAFLNGLAMNASTAQALKTTVGKVVEVADESTAAVVARLDVESLLSRWETKNETKYKVDTLNTYKARFRQTVALYGAWLADDPTGMLPAKQLTPTYQTSRPTQTVDASMKGSGHG